MKRLSTPLFKSLKITKLELGFLILLFLLALIIRVVGIEWGLPSQNNLYSTFWSDEPGILYATLLLGQGGYFVEILQNYPIFYYFAFIFFGGYYLWGRATGLYPDMGAFQAQYLQDISPFLLVGRTFTLILASLTVVATYFLGRKLFGRRVGVFASILLLFSFGHVVYSKMFRLDTALPLIFIISFYLLVNLLEAPPEKLRPYVLAALGMVLATGFKVTGWSFLLPLAMIPFLTDGNFSLKRPFRLPKLDRR
ncbi:MAG: glycosyltransferase family 39 protein, partial [Chloroflexi bacterium]|nr:glycosyltransferase family 39 protein [Chloroflexota bacterium]